MKPFFESFFDTFKVVIAVVLFISGMFAPMILGIGVHPLFILAYIITIPLCCACLDYLLGEYEI